jgi:hypothetical protein
MDDYEQEFCRKECEKYIRIIRYMGCLELQVQSYRDHLQVLKERLTGDVDILKDHIVSEGGITAGIEVDEHPEDLERDDLGKLIMGILDMMDEVDVNRSDYYRLKVFDPKNASVEDFGSEFQKSREELESCIDRLRGYNFDDPFDDDFVSSFRSIITTSFPDTDTEIDSILDRMEGIKDVTENMDSNTAIGEDD